MKGWLAVVPALLCISGSADAADDLGGAARELARRTAGFAGRGESVALSWHNVSSLTPLELTQAGAVFAAGLKDAGIRSTDAGAAVEARLTLSENQSQFLLVEEIRKGEEHQVWIAGWKRGAPGKPAATVVLNKKLIWQQSDPILDVAIAGSTTLVLSPTQIGGAPLKLPKPLPRDPRGRLRLNGPTFHAYFPGAVCSGSIEPVTAECRASDEPWVLESGNRFLLLASFAADRNYFDGRIITQAGQRKTIAPFFAAAAVDDDGRTLWFVTLLDGRTQIFDPAFDAYTDIAGFGSDIAGIDICGSSILATRPGDSPAPDAIQAFNRRGEPSSEPISFPGPITALWPMGGTAALAVVHDLAASQYEAYQITGGCRE